MDASLLFRKRAPLTEDGLPWLRGAEEHAHCAKRNASGKAAASAILVRALVAVLDGSIQEARCTGADLAGHVARVESKSTSGATAWCWNHLNDYRVPHGEENKVTYHLGVIFVVQALVSPARAADFWEAYLPLLEAYRRHSKTEAIKPALLRAADELYYWGRYLDAPVDAASDRFPLIQVADALGQTPPDGDEIDVAPLTDLEALRALVREKARRPLPKQPAPESARVDGDGFVGWQARALAEALGDGANVLLAGPTGTGKTLAVHQAVLTSDASLVTVEGKEGLTDLDFLGAILPQEDGARRWVDGPVLRALRLAQFEPVVLFFDEINRLRREHLNLLLGIMNPKPGELCRRQGLEACGDRPFYVVEVPMTSEVVWAPTAHLRVIGAGNFGTAYAVYQLDPALRRRFDLVLEFDYLPLEAEQRLIRSRMNDLSETVAKALCLVAQYTRQMHRNGDLPGAIDTASLLMWAVLCRRRGAATVAEVMQLGRLVWADVACGRDHLGLVRQAKYEGLVDYLVAQHVLPEGRLENSLPF